MLRSFGSGAGSSSVRLSSSSVPPRSGARFVRAITKMSAWTLKGVQPGGNNSIQNQVWRVNIGECMVLGPLWVLISTAVSPSPAPRNTTGGHVLFSVRTTLAGNVTPPWTLIRTLNTSYIRGQGDYVSGIVPQRKELS